MSSESRPLGGISAVVLSVASLSEAALIDSAAGESFSILEDRSSYSETVEWVDDFATVKHSLRLISSDDYSLPEGLKEGLSGGFLALISLNSKRSISVGWSSEARGDRPLRLVSCTTHSCEKASLRGYKEWLFESTDSTTYL